MYTEAVGDSVIETWTIDEVADAWERGAIVLIDVRTVQEYAFEYIEGAMLLPLASLDATRLPGQRDKRIVFMCGSGIRSKTAARAAIGAGVAPIAHMEDGIEAWKALGLPYTGTDVGTGLQRRVNS